MTPMEEMDEDALDYHLGFFDGVLTARREDLEDAHQGFMTTVREVETARQHLKADRRAGKIGTFCRADARCWKLRSRHRG